LIQSLIVRLLALATLLLLSLTTSSGEIGKVTEQSGPTEIRRDKANLPSSISSGIEMSDIVTTANSKTAITFKDDTKVQITEQSKLVIDTFVYDGEKKTGKLAIKMALGTIKYASGQIAKNDPQQVVVETPTATIGVRGTDFSGTVDETGRSTIILLPSCPLGWKSIERDCVTGNISVTTIMGTIWLTKPFEAVVVNTVIAQPKSAILNLSLDQINNMLIVTPPKEIREERTRDKSKAFNFLDDNALDKDLLKFDGLDNNALDKPTGLERNYLDSDFLLNYLDIQNSQMLSNELDQFNGLLPKYDKSTGLKYTVDDTTLTLYRETYSSYFELRVDTTRSLTLNINQDNLAIKQVVNSSGSTTITINQSN
jgi:hypothetical protein